jgi:DNA-binding NarL/FixJ family response regulator
VSSEQPLRVLIADDHAPTREDIRRALTTDPGFIVCCEAANAAAAVAAAVHGRPDVCLLDIQMPGSGIAAVWEISARLPRAKIVMLTVSDEEANLLAALRAGADGYLLKTMNLHRLPHALRGVVAGEAPIERRLVTTMVRRLHSHEPRFRELTDDFGTRGGERLTAREWQVLELLAEELTTRQIARRLSLFPSAVRSHTAAVIRKLGVADRVAAVELFRAAPGEGSPGR